MPTVYVVCKQGNDSQKAVKWLRQYTHRQCATKEDGIAGSKSHKHDNRQDSIDRATNRAVVFRDIKGGLAAWSKQIDNNFPIYWRSESKVCVRPDCLSNIAMNFPKLGDSCFSTSDIKPPTQARTGPETAENSDGKTPRYGGRWPKSARHKKIRKQEKKLHIIMMSLYVVIICRTMIWWALNANPSKAPAPPPPLKVRVLIRYSFPPPPAVLSSKRTVSSAFPMATGGARCRDIRLQTNPIFKKDKLSPKWHTFSFEICLFLEV